MKISHPALLLLLPLGSVALRSQPRSKEGPNSTRKLQTLCTQCNRIDVAFHVLGTVAGDNNAAKLWTDDKIKQEFDNLNVRWANTPFQFVYKTTTRQKNDVWAFGDVYDMGFTNDVVGKVRVGGRTTANVFVNDGTVCNTSGLARSAITTQFFPVDQFSRADFIFICGDVTDPTLFTHEMGHWLSLAHTFQGDSCDPNNPGDGVSDTPQQGATSSGQCVSGQDTCPNSPGVDPIDNYMDYSSCENKKFTPGQITKMNDYYIESRAQTKPCASNEYRLGFDIKFDSNPSENYLTYTTWGDASRLTLAPIEQSEPLIFANKQLLGYRCVKRHSMYEITLSDRGNNGIQAPGYFAFTADGNTLVRGNIPAKSYLISVDTKCADTDGRFRLELGFDDRPMDQTWSIVNSAGRPVADQTLTTGTGFSNYVLNFANSILIFEKCLPVGSYTFKIDDSDGSGIQSPGYYKLFVNGSKVKTSNAPVPNTESTVVKIVAGGSSSPSAPTVTRLSPKPTSAPTPSPPAFCFSGPSSAEVLGRGRVELKDLAIGDMVHVGKGVYEAIYSFGHRAPNASAKFLQVKTDKNTLELSAAHMVFTSSGLAMAAHLLKVGDELLDAKGSSVAIKSIKVIASKGAYAPFTPSGTIVVNGILASSYVAFENGSTLSVAGIPFSYQWMAHAFEFPHRFYCQYLSKSCLSERYTADGVSVWVDVPHKLSLWMFEQPWMVQGLMGGVAVSLFGLFSLVEFFVLHATLVMVVTTACLGAVTLWQVVGRPRAKKC